MPKRPEAPDTDDTRVSRLRREQYRKKLDRLLKAADDGPFLDLVWAARALQSNNERFARRVISYPSEAATARLGDDLYLPEWDLETVVNERLALPPTLPPPPGEMRRRLVADKFSTLEQIVQLSRALENADMGILLRRMDVIEEIRRLSHRQFEWQRGYVNGTQIYRWSFLYSGPRTKAAFADKTGIEISEFIRFALFLRALFSQMPAWRPGVLNRAMEFSDDQVRAGLDLLSAPLNVARSRAAKFQGESWTSAYRPSQLRGSPMIAFPGGLYRAPLRDLLVVRATSGLYYDLVGSPGGVRNEVADRFEQYARDLLAAALPKFQVTASPRYRWNKNTVAGPDVILRDGPRAVAVFECKARKMSFEARFGEDPAGKGEAGLDEMGDGVFQLWKFVSHVRRGLISDVLLDEQSVLLLLTLDNWMTMSSAFQKAALARGHALANTKDPMITEEDRRTVVFASIEDVELTLRQADETLFVENLLAATQEQFRGWVLPNIHRTIDTGIDNRYPLADRLGEVLPWADAYRERARSV